MSKRERFAEKFSELLREIPDDYTLPEWQHAYRQVIFSMGLKILEQFPTQAVSDPPPLLGWQASHGGGDGGGQPSYIDRGFLYFPAFVLGIQEVRRKGSRKRSG
jgi:hypothetical protein